MATLTNGSVPTGPNPSERFRGKHRRKKTAETRVPAALERCGLLCRDVAIACRSACGGCTLSVPSPPVAGQSR
jgi:hypothetical protein